MEQKTAETQSVVSALKVFEWIEKARKSCQNRLTHLGNNRHCLDCGRDFMPRRWEPCPECGSEDTRMMRERRRCKECGHRWEPNPELELCPYCHSGSSEPSPKDDLYIRQIAIPRLCAEEEIAEGYLRKVMEQHPVWPWASRVSGVGPTSLARIVGRTDIRRVETVSEMWAHAGWGLNPDGRIQRKRKGEVINYNAQLKSAYVMLGQQFVLAGDTYHGIFAHSRDETYAHLPPGHAHNRAFREMIKLFAAHLFKMWREAEELEAPDPYAFAILRHPEGHMIRPEEMVQTQKRSRPRRKASP